MSLRGICGLLKMGKMPIGIVAIQVSAYTRCYVWDDYYRTDQTVTWTGECSGGLPQREQ